MDVDTISAIVNNRKKEEALHNFIIKQYEQSNAFWESKEIKEWENKFWEIMEHCGK